MEKQVPTGYGVVGRHLRLIGIGLSEVLGLSDSERMIGNQVDALHVLERPRNPRKFLEMRIPVVEARNDRTPEPDGRAGVVELVKIGQDGVETSSREAEMSVAIGLLDVVEKEIDSRQHGGENREGNRA